MKVHAVGGYLGSRKELKSVESIQRRARGGGLHRAGLVALLLLAVLGLTVALNVLPLLISRKSDEIDPWPSRDKAFEDSSFHNQLRIYERQGNRPSESAAESDKGSAHALRKDAEPSVHESQRRDRIPEGIYEGKQWEWLYDGNRDCGRAQGCGLLQEATMRYGFDRPEPVEYRGAPWRATVGSWLTKYNTPGLFPVQEPRYGKSCPENCRGHGNCHHEYGVCYCEAGWEGDGCEDDDLYPCNITPEAGVDFWTVSICPAECNTRTGACFCGSGTKYPGRPVPEPLGFLQKNGSKDYNYVVRDSLFGKEEPNIGWCEVESHRFQEWKWPYDAGCHYDGYHGPTCDVRAEQFCLNQCSLQGVCRHGYCQCDPGWYGVDCSIPSTHVETLKGSPVWPPKLPKSARASSKSKAAAASAAAEGDINFETEGGEGQPHTTVTVMRRRPLIYIYDLPNQFHAEHLQRRIFRSICSSRSYNPSNQTTWGGWLYAAEVMVLEDLLHNEHRTTNPEEADFFYVPAPGACMHIRADDHPRYRITEKYHHRRSWHQSVQYLAVYEHIMKTFPFWNRTGGQDHIWTYFWDEGACAAPKEIWNSTMLVHWGNTALEPKSTSAYWPDNWTPVTEAFRGRHPCYDPAKDIILPAYKKMLSYIVESGKHKRPFEKRSKLFYFNGNLGSKYEPGRKEKEYSWGLRQRLGHLFGSSANKDGAVGVNASEDVVVEHDRDANYRDQLATSRFCGVLPGDGWSGRIEDAILSGCIPVIIQDGIHLPYENIFDYQSLAVRIPEADLPRMVEILRAIPEEEVRAKLAAIQKIWPRFVYRGALQLELQRQLELGYKPDDDDQWSKVPALVRGDDVVQTLIQILHFKMYNDNWRREHRAGTAAER